MKLKRSHQFIFVLILLLVIVIFTAYQYVFTPNILVEREDTHIYITERTDFQKLLKYTVEQGIVIDPISFSVLAKMMDYQENIKPGKYLLKKNMTNIEAIRLLRSGAQDPVMLQFSQARLPENVAGKLSKDIIADSATLSQMIKSQEVAVSYGFDTNTFISMFIPNTYQVWWTYDEKELLDRMKTEYDRFWNEERKAKAEKLGLSQKEVSTLASIVQAETYQSTEKPLVAGLYLNRLRQGIPLQADPTLIFSCRDFTIKQVLNIHKEVDSPYNTYKYSGLPPGPINLPAISSIDAVLNAADHDFIFMCAKGDCSGFHNFAKTNSEHNKNRVIYKNNLSKGGC